MQDNTLQNLITASFLSQSEKGRLSQYLNEYGADEKFYEMFNLLLLEELGKRGESCEKALRLFDEKVKLLDTELKSKKEKTLKKAQDELAHIDPAQISKKEKVWDEYYQKIENFQGDYEKQLKENFSVLFAL